MALFPIAPTDSKVQHKLAWVTHVGLAGRTRSAGLLSRAKWRCPVQILGPQCSLENPSDVLSRRAVLLHVAALTTVVAGATVLGSPTIAAASARETLAEAAANVPGVGPPDLYFPDYFEGEWDVKRDLYSVRGPVETPELTALRDTIGPREIYSAKFINHREHIIQDRRFNYKQQLLQRDRSLTSAAVTWNVENPDVLTVSGARKSSTWTQELKVTKRSFEDAPEGYGTFSSSEYARVVEFENSRGGIQGSSPKIYGSRLVGKYRVSSVDDDGLPDIIDAIFIEYRYPPTPPNAEPYAILKFRTFLNRKGRVNRIIKSRLSLEKEPADSSLRVPR